MRVLKIWLFGNTWQLAGALCRLVEDDELRRLMGERAQRNVRRFAPEEILSRWEREFVNLYR